MYYLAHSFIKFLIDYPKRLRRSSLRNSADNFPQIIVLRINLWPLMHHRLLYERLLNILLLAINWLLILWDVLLMLVHRLLNWHLLILDLSEYRLVQVEAEIVRAKFYHEHRSEYDTPNICYHHGD